jgi:Superfamily I DNA and RNA helicases
MTVAELSAMVGTVAPDEREFLLEYRNPSQSLMEEYEGRGWFRKNYETVKKHAEAYVRSVPGPDVVYTPDHGGATTRVRITRLLGFYASKEREIPFTRVTLAPEQTFVVRQDRGITVVNSGPGTGKTTTAAHKVAHLAFSDEDTTHSEGVLVVSYTNAAVDNLYIRLIELVHDAGEISKKPGKRIWLTTIDSLSQMHLPKGQKRKDYDAQVESAIRDKDQFASLFLTLDNKPMYSHIILDEAQDTSDERFRLLRAIYEEYEFKSFTIIGDPRQRLNIRYGGFYQEMLRTGLVVNDADIETGNYPQDTVFDFDRPLVVKYHLSYRFINPMLLDLANHLSSTRPVIHSQLLQSTEIEMKRAPSEPMRKYMQFEELTGDIIGKIRDGVRPSSICIISPVTKKVSATKTKFDAIRQILAKNNIMTSEVYGTETIYASSIQSVKGLEFDHVFFIGVSGYPGYMVSEYQDVNDGQSMNFVANTRARYSLTYLTDGTLRAPDDVPESMTTGGQAKAATYTKEIFPYSIPSSGIEKSDYEKFSSHNLLSVPHEQVSSFSYEDTPQNYLYEIVSAVLSHSEIQGKNIIEQIESVSEMSEEKFRETVRLGKIYDLCSKKGDFHITETHLPLLDELLGAAHDETSLEYHRLFRECLSGRASNLDNMSKINDIVMKIVRLLLRTRPRGTESVGAMQTIVQEQIRATSITTPTSVVIFSECLYLGALVKKRNTTKNVYLVRLQSGSIDRITEAPKPLKQYEYMVHALYAIATHVRIMRGRRRFSLANADHKRPWYFVDTEFTARKWAKSETVYDIALINGFDPFASTVTYLECDPNCFRPMDGSTVRYSDLIGAPKAADLHAFFTHLSLSKLQEVKEGETENKPVIWYFSATHDLSVFYEQHPYYEKLERDTPVVEPNPWKYESKLDYDFTFKNARIGNSRGTMSELYEKQQNTRIASHVHIHLHTAIGDALLLAEYVMTNELGA